MKIYKYELAKTPTQLIEMPLESKILDIQVQDGCLQMWVKVDASLKLVDVKIDSFWTGHDLPSDFYTGVYLATVQFEGLVWHFFMD